MPLQRKAKSDCINLLMRIDTNNSDDDISDVEEDIEDFPRTTDQDSSSESGSDDGNGDDNHDSRATVWENSELPENFVSDCTFDEPFLENSSPYQYFTHFITGGLLEYIVHETNVYALQKGVELNINRTDLELYLCAYLRMGLESRHNVRSYWETENGSEFINKLMSRKKFLDIASHLHFINNMDVTEEQKLNKIWKVFNVINVVRQKFRNLPAEHRYSVDEMMVGFRGATSPILQYMPRKPKRFGFKLFCRCGSSGVVYDFFVYKGENFTEQSHLNVTTNTVLRLCDTINPIRSETVVYADNYFSSMPLVEELTKKEIKYLGTIRDNRLPKNEEFRLKTEKELKRDGRGAASVCSNAEKQMSFVRWFDNRAVTIVTNYSRLSPFQEKQRWNRQSRQREGVKIPHCIVEYNKHMCGVDVMDSLTSLYKYNLRSKRWYMYLFYHTIHLAMNNSWLLYKRDCTIIGCKPLRLREFIAAVCNSLETRNKESIRGTKKRRSSSIPTDVRYDGTSHWPLWCSNRGRCALCTMQNTFVLCEKCNKRLCFNANRNCFRIYHQN